MTGPIRVGDIVFTTNPERSLVGHGMPGIDLVWHEKGAPCVICEAPQEPARFKVVDVDAERGVITIGSVDD